ncbi:hypothetical protein D3C85_1594390 [compost metagenome]
MHGSDRTGIDLFFTLRIAIDQPHEEVFCRRAMLLGIDFDVPLQVITKGRCLLDADAPVVENALEHLRDDAFATVQKGRRDTMARRVQRGV